jgi:hypothetical protein
MDGSEPVRPEPVGRTSSVHAEHQAAVRHLASGTLACPACDAPVALGAERLGPAAPIACPFCRHGGPLRDFLSLAAPTRPARVEVRVRVPPAR